MPITLLIDAFGRINFSGIPAGSTITKNGVEVATGITGDWTDKRPQKNYTLQNNPGSVFTFSGVEFGLVGNKTSGILDWDISITDTILGTQTARIQHSFSPHTRPNQLLWGRGGLTNEEHTVTVTIRNGVYALANITGCYSSDLSIPYGGNVTYNIGGTEIVLTGAELRPDRTAVEENLIDRWLAGYGDGTAFCAGMNVGSFLCEYIASVAGTYAATADATRRIDLKAAADQMLARLTAITGYSGGVLYSNYVPEGEDPPPPFDSASLTENGRVGYSLWYAYTVFNDTDYLTVADACVAFLLNDWRKEAGVWYLETHPDAGDFIGVGDLVGFGNHLSAAALSCAVLYNEIASAHHNSSPLKTIMLTNIAQAVDSVYDNGLLRWSPGGYDSQLYGMFEWWHLAYFAKYFPAENAVSTRLDEIDNVRAWLNGIGKAEPYLYMDVAYGYTQPAILAGRTISEDSGNAEIFRDLLHSAAFASMTPGNTIDYDPTGFAASGAPFDPAALAYSMFYTQQFVTMIGELADSDPPPTQPSLPRSAKSGGSFRRIKAGGGYRTIKTK
jgi:hypothetical protein